MKPLLLPDPSRRSQLARTDTDQNRGHRRQPLGGMASATQAPSHGLPHRHPLGRGVLPLWPGTGAAGTHKRPADAPGARQGHGERIK